MELKTPKDIKEHIEGLECPTEDPLDTTGVLLSNEIQYYSEKYNLIYPFEESHLEAASYDLTVGEQYSVGEDGTAIELHGEPDRIEIDPFQVVIIQTREFLNLPRFLIGRWNIRVTHAYDGLLWVGGPQVDPGYAGFLYCPIYNLSDQIVPLKKGEEIASIDFVKTTPFEDHPNSDDIRSPQELFPRPPDRLTLDDYPLDLESAAIGGLQDVRDDVQDVRNDLNGLVTDLKSSVAIIAILVVVFFTALSILATRGQAGGIGGWQYLIVVFSVAAFMLSLGAFIRRDS